MDLMLNFLIFVQTVSSVGLELDLEHYVVPAPSNSAVVYAANLTENPRSLNNSGSGSDYFSIADDIVSIDQPETVHI